MENVLLLHGFNKTAKDMEALADHLEMLDFRCHSITLPLTRHEFDYSVLTVSKRLKELEKNHSGKIHLVGHSTGGLLIRKVLSDFDLSMRIDRCVQIATPNQGSRLAELAGSIKGYCSLFRTVRSLHATYIQQLNLTNVAGIEIGAIAGTKSNLWLGHLIDGQNDGRVEVSSVPYEELTDFTTLPYGHKEIHHQRETAVMTAQFLKTGRFFAE
ncbi:alpha/beta fold hydrolase [Sporosarcina gallistercoris]|uniref:Alpha/beta hydrolase n=1 Tax=Sporosarcina gallistercoris TaxID=2762245 RepID=A0ABR8PK99_9BACL|nr:alpha/beta fold hydrolase [Sporosarcina gallistercoris]MBD7908572.1 alpha/beta hydrolase [Sporosarcina gallistercoris]